VDGSSVETDPKEKEEVTTMMLVDCQACPVRDRHCADCMVTALTMIPLPTLRPVGGPEPLTQDAAPLDPAERRAASVLLAAGLVGRDEVARAVARVEPRGGRQAVG
jgi:hypothetical protein